MTKHNIPFAEHGGESLKGDFYAPSGDRPTPAVVAVHGGGWQLRNADLYAHWGPWLAQRGIALFAATYRIAAPGRKAWPEAVQDVRAAVQYVRGHAAELNVDPQRIGLMGDSAGAHLAALVALAGEHPLYKQGDVPTNVKAVVGVYGVYDLWQQWRHDLASRPRNGIVEQFLGVSAIDDKRPYFDASPLSYVSAKNNATSFLICWGDADDIVDHNTQSLAFLEALKQAGHFARPVPVAGAPHFWMADPIDEPGSHTAFLAPRLLRFLTSRL
ncbi:MAG TPA: alpha/beta hydrolase [Burkholderiales bacterium]|nr:alpha/beta hydrolase [Burkholderiales bacterium]